MKIIFGDNEKRIRTYHCTNLDNPVARGYLTITNKRAIFHAIGHSCEFYEDAHIDSISGVATSYGSTCNPLKIIFGIILTAITMILFSAVGRLNHPVIYITSACLVGLMAAYLLFTSKNQYFYLSILSSSSSAINIRCESNYVSKLGNKTSPFLAKTAKSTNATSLMVREIGAIIMDFKTLGDKALEKYSVQDQNIECKTYETNNYVARYLD